MTVGENGTAAVQPQGKGKKKRINNNNTPSLMGIQLSLVASPYLKHHRVSKNFILTVVLMRGEHHTERPRIESHPYSSD